MFFSPFYQYCLIPFQFMLQFQPKSFFPEFFWARQEEPYTVFPVRLTILLKYCFILTFFLLLPYLHSGYPDSRNRVYFYRIILMLICLRLLVRSAQSKEQVFCVFREDCQRRWVNCRVDFVFTCSQKSSISNYPIRHP